MTAAREFDLQGWLDYCARALSSLKADEPLASAGICELCRYPRRLDERECKLICINCGFKRDCSDP
jgi:hypothetical protein